MKINKIIFGMFLLIGTAFYAQGKLNGYKYVITPRQFDFQKSPDLYQINSLTKFLFEKQGFEVFYNDDLLPADLKENPCLALNVKLINNSSLLKTKVMFELKDCYNQLVLKTSEGESREKEYKKGYHEAIRNAFETVEKEGYRFTQQSVLKNKKVENEQVVKAEVQKPIQKEVIIADEIIIEKPIVSEPKYQEKVPVIAEMQKNKSSFSVEGVFQFNTQTLSIKQQGNQFVVSDDKNNVIGILYPTSQAHYFIIKWLQSNDHLSKLAFLNSEGNLLIDDKETVVFYKRKSL